MRWLAVAAIVLGAGMSEGSAAQAAGKSAPAGAVAFVTPMADLASDDVIDRLLDDYERQDAARWTSRNRVLRIAKDGSSVDRLRVSVGRPGGTLRLDPRATDDLHQVELSRDWPGALRFEAGALDVNLSPHAGVGLGDLGGSAEAGATLTVAQRRDEMLADTLAGMGVRDGAGFGDQGRWYLFAAASGRAVGLNMLRSGDGWDRAGWSTDPSSALVGDAQLGVGWRRGAMQTSLGVIHREVKGEHMIWGQETKADSLVAFSFSIKPRR